MRRITLALVFAFASLTSQGSVAFAQRGYGRSMAALGDPNEFYVPPPFHGNPKYDGRFTFVRLRYRGYEHFAREGPGWSHDYPDADEHLMRIMKSLTTLNPFIESGPVVGGTILSLDDPELFKYPVAYLSEPGGWHPNDSEVKGLRKYLLKGGIVIFDDFGGSQDWMNLTYVMGQVLPGSRILDLPASHPIFDSFFKIDLSVLSRTCTDPCYRGIPSYFAIYQDNDPKKRILAVVNMDNDIGEYWQWSSRGFNVVPSNEAYKLGVNYLIYALTH